MISDCELRFKSHIQHSMKTALYHLRSDCFLSFKDPEILMHVFITIHPFTRLSKTSINKLRVIQNAAARLLTKTKKSYNLTLILYHLHWLPVSYKVELKFLLLTCKALNGWTLFLLLILWLYWSFERQWRAASQTNASTWPSLAEVITMTTLWFGNQ